MPPYIPDAPLPDPPDPVGDADADLVLAAEHAPVVLFDAAEPFEPLVAGYTVFREGGPSPSFRRDVLRAAGVAQVIEYAIWWDFDIGHAYELEHVWVHLDGAGRVVHVEASWHGELRAMPVDGSPVVEGGRPVLYSQPGKHAFAPEPGWFGEIRARDARRSETLHLAGLGGVLAPALFAGRIVKGPLADTLARTYLHRHAFEPTWSFTRRHVLGREGLVPWPVLEEWIPRRVNGWLARLEAELPRSAYRFLRIGHRGAAAHAPHNTLAAMHTAADLGADAVELDVQLTGDRRAVLAHDSHLRTAEGDLLPVQGTPLEDLRGVDLGGGERVPTLEEALEAAMELRLGLYLEIKDGRAVRPTVEALSRRGLASHAMVGSFRPDWVAEAAALAPGLSTSVLFGSTRMDAVALARSAGATYVHPCWGHLGPRPGRLLTEEWMDAARAAGLGIITWSEERPDVLADLREAGVDGICSDRPEVLAAQT